MKELLGFAGNSFYSETSRFYYDSCIVFTTKQQKFAIELSVCDSLRPERSGDRIPVGARISAPVQTGPGAHPASYIMGTVSFPGVKRPGRGVDHPLPFSAEVKERVELYLYPPLGLRGLFYGEIYLHLYYHYRKEYCPSCNTVKQLRK
jgi:hypothetical protein